LFITITKIIKTNFQNGNLDIIYKQSA